MEISQRVSKILSRHDFHIELYKGHKSVNNIGGDTIIFFSTLSDHVLHFNKFYENISKGLSYLADTIFMII